MKNNYLRLLAAILVLLLASNCNNNNDDPDTFDCINSSFIDTLSLQIIPTYIEEDSKGNILVLGNFEAVVKIVKLNAQGELLWQKEYPQLQGKEQGLIYIDEHSFFIKTSTNHYEYELSAKSYGNVWKKNSNILDASNNYIPTYELYSGNPELQLPNSNKTYLSKINADGAVLWTKEFKGDACNGHPFFRIDNNNYLLLTSEFWGRYYEIIEYDGIVDTINYPNDRNKRTVYKINNEGEVIWSTEIENIFNVKWNPGGIYSSGFEHSITQNDDRIIVNTLNNTYELSLSGELIKSYQPAYNFQGNHTYYMQKANEKENYFVGLIYTYDDNIPNTYLLKYDLATRQTIWENGLGQFPIQTSSYPGKGIIIFVWGDPSYMIKKYNPDGELLWQTDIISRSSLGIVAVSAACSGGAIVAKYEYTFGKLIMIKTNDRGEY